VLPASSVEDEDSLPDLALAVAKCQLCGKRSRDDEDDYDRWVSMKASL
jgi:hypothetical protein